jgi:hypothetical protein
VLGYKEDGVDDETALSIEVDRLRAVMRECVRVLNEEGDEGKVMDLLFEALGMNEER